MSETLAEGFFVCVGHDVNTDYIVPSHRKKETIDPNELRRYMFEDAYPDLIQRIDGNTILVAGNNFGCGSAMEVAVTVPKAAGIKAVIAKSFSRTYRRNAVNNGLLALTADTSVFVDGERAEVIEEDGAITVRTASGQSVQCEPVPPFLIEIIRAGGLVSYLRRTGQFPSSRD